MVRGMNNRLFQKIILALVIPLLTLISGCTPNAGTDNDYSISNGSAQEQIYDISDWEDVFYGFEDYVVGSQYRKDIERISQEISITPYQITLSIQVKDSLSTEKIKEIILNATNEYSDIVIGNLTIEGSDAIHEKNKYGELFNYFDLNLYVYSETDGDNKEIIKQRIFKKDEPELLIRN